MPNQRKKTKALIGGYVDKELAEAFKQIAAENGTTAKDLLETLVREEVKRRNGNATTK